MTGVTSDGVWGEPCWRALVASFLFTYGFYEKPEHQPLGVQATALELAGTNRPKYSFVKSNRL